jgi:hypothetical protein
VSKLTINGSWTQFRAPLRNFEPFKTHGSLQGFPVNVNYGAWGSGRLPAEYRASFDRCTYIVLSYNTPIAWFTPGEGWVTPAVKYSVTTSKQQGRIFTAINSL